MALLFLEPTLSCQGAGNVVLAHEAAPLTPPVTSHPRHFRPSGHARAAWGVSLGRPRRRCARPGGAASSLLTFNPQFCPPRMSVSFSQFWKMSLSFTRLLSAIVLPEAPCRPARGSPGPPGQCGTAWAGALWHQSQPHTLMDTLAGRAGSSEGASSAALL